MIGGDVFPVHSLIRLSCSFYATLVLRLCEYFFSFFLSFFFFLYLPFTLILKCPDKDVGMIIGRSGCVIKEMQSRTRCRIQIPPTAPPGSQYRVISVIGPHAGCEQVKQMIERIIAEQSSQSVMTGVAFGNNAQYGQQQQAYQQNYYGHQGYGQQQQVYGQQQQMALYGQQVQKTDYSAEWAAVSLLNSSVVFVKNILR